MRCLGYAQHFGVGIQIARETLARNGNPPPVFHVDSQTALIAMHRPQRPDMIDFQPLMAYAWHEGLMMLQGVVPSCGDGFAQMVNRSSSPNSS